MNVGVRELRNHLSKHLARVRDGETITITDHGKPVARLVAIEGESPLERLMAEGLVTPAKRRKLSSREPIDIGENTVSDLVADQRR